MSNLLRTLIVLSLCAWGGPSRLAAQTNLPSGSLTGIWNGRYHYPAGDLREPVSFTLTVIHQGESLVGVMREPNTFGQTPAPHLHAYVSGTYDAGVGTVQFVKHYDGTSGIAHAVSYFGPYEASSGSIEGAWTIDAQTTGAFTLTRRPQTTSGPAAGVWAGEYGYPDDSGRPPVPFTAILVHGRNARVLGWIREPNTFGDPAEPFLQASVAGTFHPETQTLELTKTYDGTAGQTHLVELTGQRSDRPARVSGTWTIPDSWSGPFAVQRLSPQEARRALRPAAPVPAP